MHTRSRTGRTGQAVATTALCVLVWGSLEAEISSRARAVLQPRLRLTPSDFAILDRGRAVARSLAAVDRREIAAAGAIRLDVPSHFFLERFVDIVSFKRSPIVRQIGKFDDPPVRENVSALVFETADLDALKACRVGDCGLQLSADQIQRVRTGIDWSRADARAEANELLRELLLEYVQRYRAHGNHALLEYADDDGTLRLADEVKLLVSHSAQMLSGVTEFGDALISHRASLIPTEDFIYWSKEQFGLKPVVSISHVVVYKPHRSDAPDFVIASKQIYASRYVSSSLALTLGVESFDVGRPAFYVAYMNRTRVRAFPPLVGGLVRRIAQSQTREGLEEQLALTKERLETAFREK